MQQPVLSSHKRIETIDLLRGIVMIIMALDHTRDFVHQQAMTGNPLDLSTTTPVLFFTRWITHLCAPTFVFLSGVSVWLQSRRKTKKELSRFLITRGLWLVLMEVTVITLGLTADIHFGFIFLQVIWAIGISMVILGLFIWLPFNIILIIGLLIVLGHNSLDYAERAHTGPFPVWWNLLHVPGVKPLGTGHFLGMLYPFLPWTGLMITGYCSGRLFTLEDAARQRKIFMQTGFALLAFFTILRFINGYGDPGHWSYQKNGLYTFFSFINVQKYPPSLLFMCVTTGIGFIFLSLVKHTQNKLSRIAIVYGRVPFFYFIVHFYLLHLITILLYLSRGHSVAEGMKGLPGLPFKFAVPGEGYPLWIVYLIWVGVVITMYPLCKWYDNYKTSHREKWWLSYL